VRSHLARDDTRNQLISVLDAVPPEKKVALVGYPRLPSLCWRRP
jgi:hypothetical protein